MLYITAEGTRKGLANLRLRLRTDIMGEVVSPIPSCDLVNKEAVPSLGIFGDADVQANPNFERLKTRKTVGLGTELLKEVQRKAFQVDYGKQPAVSMLEVVRVDSFRCKGFCLPVPCGLRHRDYVATQIADTALVGFRGDEHSEFAVIQLRDKLLVEPVFLMIRGLPLSALR